MPIKRVLQTELYARFDSRFGKRMTELFSRSSELSAQAVFIVLIVYNGLWRLSSELGSPYYDK
jgi:hypothetical protein